VLWDNGTLPALVKQQLLEQQVQVQVLARAQVQVLARAQVQVLARARVQVLARVLEQGLELARVLEQGLELARVLVQEPVRVQGLELEQGLERVRQAQGQREQPQVQPQVLVSASELLLWVQQPSLQE
jgi:hypothetical protein